MQWIQDNYIDRVAVGLDGFTRTGETTCNFRCPFCGDSTKNRTKRRGYLFAKGGDYRFFCHNCRASYRFYDFLKALDPEAAREYAFETLGSRREDVQQSVTESEPVVPRLGELPEDIFVPLALCSPIDPVARYVRSRSIPRAAWGRLRAVPHFLRVAEYLPAYEGRIPNDKPRLALPCRDVINNVTALVCRSVDGSEPRYVMLKADEAEPIIFGIECVRFDRPVIVVEGPVDSLFLPNSVAVAGTDLPRIGKYLSQDGVWLVFDNQPRNAEVIQAMRRAGEQGFRVCVWPDDTPGKDINEMVKGGWPVEKIVQVINARSFSGLRLETEIASWKKISLTSSRRPPRN